MAKRRPDSQQPKLLLVRQSAPRAVAKPNFLHSRSDKVTLCATKSAIRGASSLSLDFNFSFKKMSEELAEEVQVINSIYGDGCLVQAGEDSDVYVLALPEETVSLRLHFPHAYPDVPPRVVSTIRAGRKRGVAARNLELFRSALGQIYQPGQVCLFDAIEELKRLRQDDGTAQGSSADRTQDMDRTAPAAATYVPAAAAGLGPEPPWIVSDASTELKSVFIARCARVTSPDQATQFVQHLLASDKRVRAATHNITAWRIQGPNGISFQDCDDDNETAAGRRLLHLMQLMNLWDTMVIVTRWYGGQKLGPRRFALINAVARDAFVKAGLVDDASASHKEKGHGG